MTDKEKTLCDILNGYCFDKVWNEVVSEYRENINPKLLDKRSHIGNLYYNNDIISLPTGNTGSYFVYGLFNSDLAIQLDIPVDTWVDTETLCNQYNILLDMYHNKGKMLHKKYVYIKITNNKNTILFAVYKDMTKRMIPINEMDDIYFTVYYDSDITNDCTVYSYQIPANDNTFSYRANLQSFLNDLKTQTEKLVIYINGYECTTFEPVLNNNDYIDIIRDENIQIIFDLDLTVSSNDFTFYSDKDKTYKQIIHIPKNLNPDKKVITHNTCDIWVRRKDPITQEVEGLYLHRAADRGVAQITHNDLSIPLYILDAYRDYLNTQNVTLRVVCRIHEKNNVLIRDASYIDMMYTQSDALINNTLKGPILPSDMSFWKASELEKSTYVDMFFDLADLYTKNLDYYVDALGYYHTITILASRIDTKTITNPNNRYFAYEKPNLYKLYLCLPILYRNGIKIKNEMLSYTDDGDIVHINIKEEQPLFSGDKITTVLYMDGPKQIYKVNPSDTDKYIDLNYSEFKIYEVITNEFENYLGVNMTSNISYKDVTETYGLFVVDTTTNGVRINYGLGMYEKTYVICNEQCSYLWNKDISDLVLAGENIVIPIETKLETEDINVPVLNYKNISVYLNGKYLIKDLDYIVNNIKDGDGNSSFHQIVIQSMEYLVEPGNNYVEVLLNTNEIEDRSTGFQIDNICSDQTPAGLWFPTVSLFHIDGKLETEIVDNGIYLAIPTDKYRQGAPYEVQTSVPNIIKDFMSNYHTNTDRDRLISINNYFGNIKPALPPLIVLPQSHRIYSTLINTVLRDILFNGKQFANDPDQDRIAVQLQEYEYLRSLDLVQINNIDNKFIDYYPAYRQYIINGDLLLLCRTIIDSNMPVENIRAKADTRI